MLARVLVAVALIWGAGMGSTAYAQETTSITYDALGRVTKVDKSGGPASGVQTTYDLDPAGNRTKVKVVGSVNGNGNLGGGATSSSTILMVLPLNGFTLIPVTR